MYPLILKNRAIKHYITVKSLRKASSTFGVGKSTLSRWLQPVHTARKERKSKREAATSSILDMISNNPFTTLSAIKATLATKGIKLSCTSAWRSIKQSGFTRKRVRHRSSYKQATLDQSETFATMLQHQGERISIDETSVYLHESPRYGYAPRGAPVHHRTKKPPRSSKMSLLLAISDKRGIIAHECVK